MIEPVQIEERIAKCEKILKLDPNSQIFAALAEALRKKGELEKAFRICQNGLKIHPTYGSAHVVMAKINLDRRLFDWAEAEAQKAADIDGRTRTVELLLAEIFIYKGEFTPAIRILKKLSQSDPDNRHIKKLLDIAQRLPQEQEAGVEGSTAPEAITAPEPIAVDTPESQPVRGPLSTREVLSEGIRINGIDGALFINFEGLVGDSEWTLRSDPAAFGATMGEIGNLLNQELIRNSFGDFIATLIETEVGTYYLLRVPDGFYLFVTRPTVSLGSLRIKVENLLVSRR